MDVAGRREGLKSNVSGFINDFFVVKVEIDFRELTGKSRKGFKVTFPYKKTKTKPLKTYNAKNVNMNVRWIQFPNL